MSTFLKDVAVVYRRISMIARELGLPLSLDKDMRKEQELSLFPMVISEVASPNYSTVMKQYLLRGIMAPIRFRIEDYSAFQSLTKDCMIRWFLQKFILPDLPLGSYFLLSRTVTHVELHRDEKRLWQLTLQTKEERYPLSFPFLNTQRFIIDDLLCDWGLNPEMAYSKEGTLRTESTERIVGKRFFYLKFFHRYDAVHNRGVFWKYRYVSTDIGRVFGNFQQGVEKGYVRGYSPDLIPKNTVSFFRHSGLFKHSWRTVDNKRLHIYRYNHKAALMVENRFVGFIDSDSQLYWLGRVPNKSKMIEALLRESKSEGSLIQPSLFN
ncbi:MAG: hypothetical protein VX278_12435 [Myxococcota bacterium]|nr:hypothetical protein [Myxococcota bacterium]